MDILLSGTSEWGTIKAYFQCEEQLTEKLEDALKSFSSTSHGNILPMDVYRNGRTFEINGTIKT